MLCNIYLFILFIIRSFVLLFWFHIIEYMTPFLPLKPDFYLYDSKISAILMTITFINLYYLQLFILHKRWENVKMDLQSLSLYFPGSLEPLFMISCIYNHFQSGSDLKEHRLVQFLKTSIRWCLLTGLSFRKQTGLRFSKAS